MMSAGTRRWAVRSGIGVVAAVLTISPANAQERRRGAYIGMQQGFTLPSALQGPLTGNSQPTRCDSLLYAAGAAPACPPGEPREIYSSDFSLGAGYAGGLQAGFMWGAVRGEVEYSRRFEGSGRALIYATEDLVASDKGREWNPNAPPFARVSDVRAHEVFANAYYDMALESRWTPYVGAGFGVSWMSLSYGNRYVRKTLTEGYFPVGGVDPATGAVPDWQRNASGTASAVETEITRTLLGFQVLAGIDYNVTDRVSVGVQVRGTRLVDPIVAEFPWDLVRSHESVLADGVTPYTLGLEIDDLQHLVVSLSLKLRF